MQQERKKSKLERFTNWLIESISQLAQLILLVAVAYAAYKVSPGHSDNVILDQIWIITQMIALDVSAPGLASISKQEYKLGHEERAKQLKTIAKTLLIMGILTGAEAATFGFFPNINSTFKNIVSWLLMIGRVATALLYMYALHSGGKEEKSVVEQIRELTESYEKQLQDLIQGHKKQSQEFSRQREDLLARQKAQEAQVKEVEDRYTQTLDLQQQQSRQYIELYDRYQSLNQSHKQFFSDHTKLQSQHKELTSTHQMLVSQHADMLTRSRELEKQSAEVAEERDSLKNILSAIRTHQVSQPQEKVTQTSTKKLSHSPKKDRAKVSQPPARQERESQLQEAWQELINAGERVSARTLADKTGYNRNITNDWLRSQNMTSQHDSEDETILTNQDHDTEEHRVIQIEKYKDVTA